MDLIKFACTILTSKNTKSKTEQKMLSKEINSNEHTSEK